MREDAARGFIIILCFLFLLVALPSTSSLPCHPDQQHALLRFKQSLSIPGLIVASWMEDEDCCSWEGIACDNSTGNVIGLDLTSSALQGSIDSSSPLFSLRHLRGLSLQGNDLLGSKVPPEIGVFAQLTSLNLSYSNISGILPIEISLLSRMVSLDLSDNFLLEMQDHTMRMLVSNLTQLEELDLGFVNMSTVNPTCFMNFSSSLISLKLLRCSLWGKFPEFIFGLPNLRVIDISGNVDLTGTLPESKWSPSLDYLSLEVCNFTGAVPNSIGNLSRSTYLDLSYNNFTIDLGILSTLVDLQFLLLYGLSVLGEDANYGSSLPKLRELHMGSCNLSKFPSFLSGSKELRFLHLGGNKIQEIPVWFWSIGIDTLEELYLNYNILRGSILPFICRLTSLSTVGLSGSYLTGVIPQCLGNLTNLQWLDLSNNSLSGPLPSSLANCTSLITLDVSYNMLEGPFPMPPAFIFEFQINNNRFGGSIPQSMCHLTSLYRLDMSQNDFKGAIPQCLGNHTELSHLSLSNNSLSGPLPPSLTNCTYLLVLDVSYNSISGAPPTWLSTTSISDLNLKANKFGGRWPQDIFLRSASLEIIDLSDNKLEGPLPLPSYFMRTYSVSNNHFSGSLSSLLCNATHLQLLDLSNNSLTGVLPDCLENITKGLLILNLQANEFHGKIPYIFYEGSTLTSLDVSGNQFEGPLPRSLAHCKQLEVLNVANNKIEDSFPNWLGDLPLKVLSLRFNHFCGRVIISRENHPFPMASIMDLSHNSFNGNLQDEFIIEMFSMTRDNNYDFGKQYLQLNFVGEYYSVTIDLKGIETKMVKINVHFAMLDLSSNQFHGEIPKSIGLLKSLKGLNFSHNRFTGSIPPSIGNLTNLESLDLSSNHLIGEIPNELVKITFLGFLDLSWNNFTGPIPSGGHFNTFLSTSFQGNPGLCGIPLTRLCGQGYKKAQPSSEGKDDGKKEGGGWMVWEYAALGLGTGMGMGISLGYMVLEMRRPLWLVRMVMSFLP